ncbi:carbohydrate sulfotransferase 1-like isoform X2 [Gigantopelta aegis]|uniref:carbohydrate sulfotransferase 1-like isoform X2 n=1 Tax=Gigantopelta aegis TaxID=1735272 RepID=UPI001B888D60|nr:carbohydrate sulfotransferase 1-like isoform X2 [Gigantopelta aegis]
MDIAMLTLWRPTKRWPRLIYLLALFVSVCLNISLFLVKVTQRVSDANHHSSYEYTHGHNQQPRSSARQTLIVSYMRSGSTLTGDILQQHRDVFYVFEPLFTVDRLVKYYLPAVYLDKPSRLKRLEASPLVSTIEDVLRCKFADMDVLTLHQHHMDKSHSTRDYLKCAQNSTLLHFHKMCLSDLVSRCLGSKHVVVKSIRMDMSMTGQLLKQLPNLKVIHLIRDPRATILSRVQLGLAQMKILNLNIDVMKQQAQKSPQHCDQVKNDLDEAYRLRKEFPGRVAILLYEKIVQSPVSMAEQLYKFLGMKITKEIKQYVFNITNGGMADTCAVCTIRKNASVTAFKWRTQISLPIAQMIDRACANVYSDLGYVPISAESQILNESFLTWRERYVPGMLTNVHASLSNAAFQIYSI